MMKKLRFLIFLIFNSAYHDGNNEKADPYTYSMVIMLVWELFTILLGIELLSLSTRLNIFKALVSLFGGTHSFGVALLALVVPPNYYFFIRKKRLDIYYEEFKDAEINTQKNRKTGYIYLIIYWPIWLALMILLRSYGSHWNI